jgi:hypothetical protein
MRVTRTWIAVVTSLSITVAAACGGGDDDGAGDDDDDGQTDAGGDVDSGSPAIDAAPDDGAAPDGTVCELTQCGAACVDTETDPAHCGGCDMACTPAQGCETSECACPEVVLLADPAFVFETVDLEALPPFAVAVGAYMLEGSAEIHLLLVAYDPMATETETDIDIASIGGPVPSIGIFYDYDPETMTPRAGFATTSGIVSFSRACAEGIAGSLTDIELTEVDAEAMPIDGGCTYAMPSVAFDLGSACPPPR